MSEKIEIKTFCLGCGREGRGLIDFGDPCYSGAPKPAWCGTDECQVKRQIFNDVADETEASLYKRLVNAGCEIDHHESDLYVKKTPISEILVERYATVPANVTEFRGVVDGEQWFDVPFSYEPFWSKPRVRVVEEKA